MSRRTLSAMTMLSLGVSTPVLGFLGPTPQALTSGGKHYTVGFPLESKRARSKLAPLAAQVDRAATFITSVVEIVVAVSLVFSPAPVFAKGGYYSSGGSGAPADTYSSSSAPQTVIVETGNPAYASSPYYGAPTNYGGSLSLPEIAFVAGVVVACLNQREPSSAEDVIERFDSDLEDLDKIIVFNSANRNFMANPPESGPYTGSAGGDAVGVRLEFDNRGFITGAGEDSDPEGRYKIYKGAWTSDGNVSWVEDYENGPSGRYQVVVQGTLSKSGKITGFWRSSLGFEGPYKATPLSGL